MDKKKFFPLIIAIIVTVLIAGGIGFYSFRQNQMLSGSGKNNTTELETMIKKIGQFMLLPTDERPTLATVTDKNKLIGQVFFKKAENGDKVLIYAKNKKAILFRPSTNKVIEVGALDFAESNSVNTKTNLTSATSNVAPTTTSSAKLKMIILNGTNTPGLALKMVKTITDKKITNVEIIDTDNAKKKDYQKSVIVDLTGKKRKTVDDLASLLDLDVLTKLPDGEAVSTAEAIIIIGQTVAPTITP